MAEALIGNFLDFFSVDQASAWRGLPSKLGQSQFLRNHFRTGCFSHLHSQTIRSDHASSAERMLLQQTSNYLITSLLVSAGAAVVIRCDFRFYGCA